MIRKILLFVTFMLLPPFLFVGSIIYYENYIRYQNIFDITDQYVENIYTKHDTPCVDSEVEDIHHVKYTITYVDRIIVVKINDEDESRKDYLRLKNVLKHRYQESNHVRHVFINSSGTICIDCRK